MYLLLQISGRGLIAAEGGNGKEGVTGAGGGGRVSLAVTGLYKYQGLYSARGGDGANKTGSPGTVYVEEARPGFRSKRLVIESTGIYSESPLPVFLNESGASSYSFDVLTLLGKVSLNLEKGMEIKKLISDPDSEIHVQDHVVLTVEPLSKALQPLCSFHVDRYGEIRLPDIVTFLGNNNMFAGTLTGILDMIIGANRRTQFSASARTARFIDGKYTFITNRGEYRFSSLFIKNNAVLTFEDARLKKIPLTVGNLELGFGAVLQGSWLSIRASDVTVHSGGKIELSGQGYGSGKGTGAGGLVSTVGTGGGYGGYGGNSTGIFGKWYGFTLKPNMTGSGGGPSSSGAGGGGGGFLQLEVVRSLRLDGEVRVDGESGLAVDSGGGSGGSVWLQAQNIAGNGLISTSGGDGNRYGGGGSGGRIAVYLQRKITFEGDFSAHGGKGNVYGAAGTVYIQDNNKLTPRKRIIIKNAIFVGEKPLTVMSEPQMQLFVFEELQILGSSRFEIVSDEKPKLTIRVARFRSDGKGEFVLRKNQTMYAEVLEAQESHMTLNTNLHVEHGANLVLASNLTVDGASLTVEGKISDVRHLTVESGSQVKFGLHSQTTIMERENFLFQSAPGTQQFASITLKSGSDFGAPQELSINVGLLDIKNGVLLRGKFISINSQTLLIGRGASLTTSSSTNGAEPGKNSPDGASGGGHGSPGGAGYNGLEGGEAYGTLYRPSQPGSCGGDGIVPNVHGKGGGVIKVTTDFLYNDGFITADGGNGSPKTKGGGGSGGSVLVIAQKVFSGSGTVSANGGQGDGPGGCGSGGRVAIIVAGRYSFRGIVKALGGKSVSGHSGGAGTVFIEEVRFKQPYLSLYIDNQDNMWENYVTLSENRTMYEFHELHVTRKASLRMAVSQQIGSLVLKIHKLIGDRSGLLHLYQNHTAEVEIVQSQETTTKTPINFRIESGGEVKMATTVYITGNSAVALECNGTITGVGNLHVTQNRVIKLHNQAHTTSIINGKRVEESPGVLQFTNVKLNSGSSITMEEEIELKLIVGFLSIKFSASLSAHHIRILASKVDVEVGALLSCSGDNNARAAFTPTELSNLPHGAGAGHASTGGRGYGGQGGSYYGSLYNPVESGRRGGSGPGGALGGNAGGYIVIETGNELVNDGTITVAGGNAKSGSDAGGGSGGGLLIKTQSFTGIVHSF